MYRSASSNRVADEYFASHPSSSSSSSSTKASATLRALSSESNELPVYEPLSEAAKKERNRDKFAHNAVHIIPLLLLLCAFILWALSTPDIDIQVHGGIISDKVEGLTIEGDADSDGTQKAHLPFNLEDLASTTQHQENHRKFLTTKLP